MLPDWFTVAAQAINFLVLVALLKRFLYKPVLQAVEAREARISTQLSDAGSKMAEAGKEKDAYLAEVQAFDRERNLMLQQASDAAKAERDTRFAEIRQEADGFREKLHLSMEAERERLEREVATRTQQEVFAIARRVLGDMADASLEERIVANFVVRLRKLAPGDKERLARLAHDSQRVMLVRSAFALSETQQALIQQALAETVGGNGAVLFVVAPDLVGGIEWCTDGHKIAWTIAEYLGSLKRGLNEALDGHPSTAPPVAAHAD